MDVNTTEKTVKGGSPLYAQILKAYGLESGDLTSLCDEAIRLGLQVSAAHMYTNEMLVYFLGKKKGLLQAP